MAGEGQVSNLFEQVYKRVSKAVTLDRHQSTVRVGHFCEVCLNRPADEGHEAWCDRKEDDGQGSDGTGGEGEA